MNTKIAILWLALLVLANSQCSGNVGLSDTESAILTAEVGSRELALKLGSTPVLYTYALKKPMSSPPQISLGLISFDASPITGFAFSLEAGQTNQNLVQVILFTPWNITVWRSLKVSLLVSARSDTELGVSSFRNLQPGQDSVTFTLKKALPSTAGYIARAFLCGVSLSKTANVIAVSVLGKELATTTFNVGISSTSTPTDITISYLLFSPSTAGFSSYGGIIDQPQVPSSFYMSIHKSLCSLENTIYGLNGFSIGAAPSISLSATIDKSFVLYINPGQITTKLLFSYIVYGPSPKFVCANCANKTNTFSGNCVSQCNLGEALYTYPDGSTGCIVCSALANLVVSDDGKNCVCRQGTNNIRGVCTSIEPYKTDVVYGPAVSTSTSTTNYIQTTQSDSSSTQGSYAAYLAGLAGGASSSSSSGYAGSSSSANVPLRPTFGDSKYAVSTNQGQTFLINQPATTQPITVPPTWSPNAASTTVNGGSSFSIPVVSNQPVAPTASSNGNTQTITVTTTSQSVNNCSGILNSYWNGVACACLPAFTNSSGNCVASGQQGWTQTSSTTTGATVGGPGSLPPTTNPIGGQQGWTQTSSTTTGATVGGPGSLPPITTGGPSSCASLPNSFWDGNGCACFPGFTLVNGQCQLAAGPAGQPTNSYPGSSGIPGIPSGTGIPTVINPSSGTTAPTTPPIIISYPAPNGGQGPTYPGYPSYPPGFPNIDPIVCPNNRYPLAGICVCKPGYFQSPYGDCIHYDDDDDPWTPVTPRDCGPNGRYNYLKRQCVCRNGFYWNNFTCVPGLECPNNSTRINATACYCNPPLIPIGGSCVRCYESGFWDGNTCRYLCGTYATYNLTLRKCICNDGYEMIAPGVCQSCPPNSRTINGSCATCPRNSRLIGLTCVCNPGYTRNPQGYCVSNCPQGATYNATVGRCRCLQQNYFFNNGVCAACPAGSYGDGYICRVCPAGTTVGNGICECSNTSLMIFSSFANACVTCPFNSFPRTGYCVSCPINATYDPVNDRCNCITGYARVGALCINICPDAIYVGGNLCAYCPLNSVPRNNECVCKLGYAKYVASGPCLKSCPEGTFLTNAGNCVACPIGQGYNTRTGQCQCLAGFSMTTSGFCTRTCPYASTLSADGNTCQCNAKYYPANGVCLSCPPTCAQCTGPLTCTSCVPGYKVVAGQCVPNDPNVVVCLPNQFLNQGGVCTNCGTMCMSCTGLNQCTRCATGFNLTAGNCVEICGDGIRIFQQCDDGNIAGGDGCSPTCTIEPGWICMKNPANPALPDYCVNPSQNNSKLILQLVTSVQTSYAKTTFGIGVYKNPNCQEAVLNYINTYSAATAAAKSREMISFSFSPYQQSRAFCEQVTVGPNSRARPECALNTRWNCEVNWNNQPPSVSVSITLNAKTPDNLQASLVVPYTAIRTGSTNARRN